MARDIANASDLVESKYCSILDIVALFHRYIHGMQIHHC